ncbi:hypothetical protein [Malonomonas rubra]|uniref:hypothetical protein n=1 Tax=Malonomonas rubra TaxID=57040 RepID=UPI001114E632|nr:hypothetical protein [Malonomonas rubra]
MQLRKSLWGLFCVIAKKEQEAPKRQNGIETWQTNQRSANLYQWVNGGKEACEPYDPPLVQSEAKISVKGENQ